MAFANGYSVKIAVRIQNIFTVAKLIALGIIIVGGIVWLAGGNSHLTICLFLNANYARILVNSFQEAPIASRTVLKDRKHHLAR